MRIIFDFLNALLKKTLLLNFRNIFLYFVKLLNDDFDDTRFKKCFFDDIKNELHVINN